jgi:osmotically-inducible protein OsmY
VPVVRDGRGVGIVSRANLLHGLAVHPESTPPARSIDDRAVRDAVLHALERDGWTAHGRLNVIVKNGAVELWGLVDSEEARRAIRIAVENVPGVAAVKDNMGRIPPWLWGS